MKFSSGIYSAFDFGTGSIRFTIAEVDAHGALMPLHRAEYSHTVGADAVSDHGEISVASADALLRFLEEQRYKMEEFGSKNYRFIATEVLRSAKNGAALRQRIYAELGLNVEEVSHEDELALSVMGNVQWLHPEHDSLFVEFGGGSTEIAVVSPNAQVKALKGLKIGARRDVPLFELQEMPEREAINIRRAQLRQSFATALEELPVKADMPVLMCGIPFYILEFLTGVPRGEARKFDGRETRTAELETVFEHLYSLGRSGRNTVMASRGGNNEMQTPAVMLVSTFAQCIQTPVFRMCSSGIQRGAILSLAAQGE